MKYLNDLALGFVYLSFCMLSLCSIAFGQTAENELRIGIIVSQTGNQSERGSAHARAFDILNADLAQGWFGLPIRVIARDDQSQVSNALSIANELVQTHQVHVIICCSSPYTTSLFAQQARNLETPILSLSYHPAIASNPWMFGVEAPQYLNLERMMQDAQASGLTSMALMSSQAGVNDFVVQHASKYGLEPRLLQNYDPNAQNLMPEALFVASKQAEAVMVWDNDNLSQLAYHSLRERGYEGAVYLSAPSAPSPVLVGARMVPRGQSFMPVQGQVSFQPFSGFRSRYVSVASEASLPTAVYASNALALLNEAVIRGLGFVGFQSGGAVRIDTWQFRQAIRDGLIAMPMRVATHGVYDFTYERQDGMLPESLPVMEYYGGALQFSR